MQRDALQLETLSDVSARVCAKRIVHLDDVLAIRRIIYGNDGRVDEFEAEALYAIERARTGYLAEWSKLFVEALTDHILNQVVPRGYMSEDNAKWVMAQVKRRKEPSTDGDLALVANLIEQARDVPAFFSAFGLRLCKEAVIYGDGPDGRGRIHQRGCVTGADVEMLRRILFGAGSEGLLAVSHEEAEALVAIADMTTGAANVPEFDELFARAIGNYLIGATGRPVPKREDALRWETPAAYKTDTLSALSGLFRGAQALSPDFVIDTIGGARTLSEDVEWEIERQNQIRDIHREDAEVITPEKAEWLLSRVNKNGVMNAPEQALIRFIAREASYLDPALKSLIARVA